MSNAPLMPKATAVWLVDNTSLSFEQIAEFCNLHRLEVRAIADGESAQGIKGMDPFTSGQLSRDELEKAQNDPEHKLKLAVSKIVVPELKKKGPRYTPLSKRQDRPNAIYWLVRSHPELKDAQIIRLVGTTKNTINAIRTGQHWNSSSLVPMDPVTLGLCTQISLDFEVGKAAKYLPPKPEGEEDATLIPAGETQGLDAGNLGTPSVVEQEEVSADSVFANFSKSSDDDTADENAGEAAGNKQ